MNASRMLSPLALALLLPIAAPAAEPATGIRAEIREELVKARVEVRTELAEAKRELDTGNLRVDQGLPFGKQEKYTPSLPKAEITPAGELLIDGKAQALDAGQRRHALAYRALVVGMAKTGIDIGQRTADVALDAVDRGVFSLMLGAMTGSLERRIERVVREEVEPGMRGLCRQLPAVMASQQQLAARVPQFQPYANLRARHVEDCLTDVRQSFASI